MNPRPADRAGAPETSGVVSVPGDQLDSLTSRVRLNGAEWRITLSILISPVPVSARCVATHLRPAPRRPAAHAARPPPPDAGQAKLALLEFLELLLRDEIDRRDRQDLARRIEAAASRRSSPTSNSCGHAVSYDRARVRELFGLHSLGAQDNVIFRGPSASAKAGSLKPSATARVGPPTTSDTSKSHLARIERLLTKHRAPLTRYRRAQPSVSS
jgi:hypothetical protein